MFSRIGVSPGYRVYLSDTRAEIVTIFTFSLLGIVSRRNGIALMDAATVYNNNDEEGEDNAAL